MVYHTFIIQHNIFIYYNVSYDEISLWYISHTAHQENPACTKSFLRDNIRLTSGDHQNTKIQNTQKLMKYALPDWDALSLRAGSGGLNVKKGQKGAKSGLMKAKLCRWETLKYVQFPVLVQARHALEEMNFKIWPRSVSLQLKI